MNIVIRFLNELMGEKDFFTVRGLFLPNGRRNRRPHNYFTIVIALFNVIFTTAVGIICLLGDIQIFLITEHIGYKAVTMLFGVVFSYIGLMNTVKRMHDLGYSGMWLLFFPVSALVLTLFDNVQAVFMFLAVVIWAIIVIFYLGLMCKRGTVGPNRFGPDPLEEIKEDELQVVEIEERNK